MPTLQEQIRERRLDRMRLGSAACDVVPLLSDPEIRVALVPLTEAEYQRSLETAAAMEVMTTQLGMEYAERRQQTEIIWMALREVNDLQKHGFGSSGEMLDELETQDINHLWDHYLEMVDTSSPAIDGVPPDELDNLKKVLQEIPWNELSGTQWYAAKRFLGSVLPTLPLARSLGSSSIKSLTLPSGNPEPAQTASQSGTS